MENNANAKGEIVAPASLYSHQDHTLPDNAMTPATPRSHSLLAYFQPTSSKRHTSKSQGAPVTNNSSELHSSAPSNLFPCRYCDKPTCSACTRQCELCQHRFCTFCTKIDYESSITERIMCFECAEDHVGDGCSHGMRGGKAIDDCDMMEL